MQALSPLQRVNGQVALQALLGEGGSNHLDKTKLEVVVLQMVFPSLTFKARPRSAGAGFSTVLGGNMISMLIYRGPVCSLSLECFGSQ